MSRISDLAAEAVPSDAEQLHLQELAKTHGAESRAADIVAPAVIEGRFRFVPELGWMEWDGRRWVIDGSGEDRARQRVREYIDRQEKDERVRAKTKEDEVNRFTAQILARADASDRIDDKGKPLSDGKVTARVATEAEREELGKLVTAQMQASTQANIWLNLLSEAKIGNITKLCRRIEGVLTAASQLDQHHHLLNCRNGLVDLQTGKLHPHSPGHLITKLAGGDYDPAARSARWDQALGAVHPDTLAWFQLRAGQSMTGYTPDDDSLTLCDGGGENGKSTVMKGLSRAAGDYFTLVSDRVLLTQPGQHPTEMMDLRGARFALMEETPEEGRLDTHQLKIIVGTPYIKARLMRKDTVQFAPTHTLWINTNHLPQVDATDHATWRRLKRIPWPYRFVRPGTETEENHRAGDKTLRPYMEFGEEVPTVALTWMVQGAVAWFAQRGNPVVDPPRADAAARAWREQCDVGYRFAAEHLLASECGNHFITADNFRTVFEGFLQSQGKKEWSATTINQRMPDSIHEALGVGTESKVAKVTTTLVESVADIPPPAAPWKTTAPKPAAQVGRATRMWKGIRFRTKADDKDAEDAERLLKVVPAF